jgi:hypothetical protein
MGLHNCMFSYSYRACLLLLLVNHRIANMFTVSILYVLAKGGCSWYKFASALAGAVTSTKIWTTPTY